jgi:hypothetical protein
MQERVDSCLNALSSSIVFFENISVLHVLSDN